MTISLEVALKNLMLVRETATSKKPNYVRADFSLSFKAKDQAKTSDLVNTAFKLYTLSKSGVRKFGQLQRLYEILGTMDSTDTNVIVQIKKVLGILEAKRLAELPHHLSKLLGAKEMIHLIMQAIEESFPQIRCMAFMMEHGEKEESIDSTGQKTTRFNLDLQATKDEGEALMNSRDGTAFLARYPVLRDDTNINLSSVTPGEMQLLKNFIRQASPLTSQFAKRLYCIMESGLSNRRFAAIQELVLKSGEIMKPLLGSDKYPLDFELEKILPGFEGLFKNWHRRNMFMARKEEHTPAFHAFMLEFLKEAQELATKMGALDEQYRALYEEYTTLFKKVKCVDEAPALPSSSIPSFLQPDTVCPLPTAAQFEQLSFSFGAINTSLDFGEFSLTSAGPTKEDSKATKPKTVDEKADGKERTTERVEKKAVKSNSEKESKDNKGESEAACTLFDRRDFPYESLQYADRVLEWETDPKKALERPEYRNLPDHAVDEVIWKHATKVVDQFIGTAYSRRYKWQDKDLAYVIQAEIEWKGKTYKGFFRYAFNEKGVMYHRDFGEKTNFKLVDAICKNKEFGDEDFPTFEQAQKDYHAKGKPVEVVKLGSTSYKIDALDIVTVEDPKYGLKIHLFKRGKI